MQGNIWVVPNHQGLAQSMGLVLRFQLRPSIAVAIPEPGESSEHTHSNSLFRGVQVLLVDDDNVNRAVTRKLLEKLGCTVTSVSSGFECLSAIGPSGSSFQIVLLDLHMPELDGFEVAMRIRKYRSHSWPLIVALTASADEDVWERCMHIGMNGIIRKPVLLQGIASELRRVLMQANKVV
jgi:ethylene receptor